jgi:hypothetical protein
MDTVSTHDTVKKEWVAVLVATELRDRACVTVIEDHFYIVVGRERGHLKGKELSLFLTWKI